MDLFRIEYDVETGERREFPQVAYSNGDDVIVLDEEDDHPEGFEIVKDGESQERNI